VKKKKKKPTQKAPAVKGPPNRDAVSPHEQALPVERPLTPARLEELAGIIDERCRRLLAGADAPEEVCEWENGNRKWLLIWDGDRRGFTAENVYLVAFTEPRIGIQFLGAEAVQVIQVLVERRGWTYAEGRYLPPRARLTRAPHGVAARIAAVVDKFPGGVKSSAVAAELNLSTDTVQKTFQRAIRPRGYRSDHGGYYPPGSPT